jgi:hypothetical protein
VRSGGAKAGRASAAPVTLTTDLYFGGGGIVLGMDGSDNAIAAWVGNMPLGEPAASPSGNGRQ